MPKGGSGANMLRVRTLLLRAAMRVAVGALHAALTAWWFVRRPETHGVSAIAVTPEGQVILVTHTYVRGWYLPGGGRPADEAPQAACLRELREEIGMTAHGEVTFLGNLRGRPSFKRDTVALFLVEDVQFEPKPSLEIEAVETFAPTALPEGVTPAVRRRIEEWQAGERPPEEW